MTEQNKPDPPWKAALREALNEQFISSGDEILDLVLPHMETSYKSGRMAGASQAGYRLVQKNLEQAKKLREVREVADALAARMAAEPNTERASGLYEGEQQLRKILGEDSP